MFASLRNSGRIATIDLLKIFASFLVILSHCMMIYIDNGTSNPLFNFIWLTQMPLFMFASGFVNNNRDKFSSLKKYFYRELKNFLTLIIPCLSFLIITCGIQNKDVLVAFVDFYFDPQSNLWFLWALFVIHLIFDFGLFLSTVVKKKISFLIPVVISLLASIAVVGTMFIPNNNFNYSILAIKLIAYYIPFYCFGYLFYFLVNSFFFNKKPLKILFYIILCFCFLFLVFECFYYKSIHSFDDYNVKYLVMRVLGSFSSILVLVFVFDLISKNVLMNKIAKYGAFSLQTYYLHIIFLHFFKFSTNDVCYQWLLSVGIAVLLVLMVITSIILFYFVPFLHLILFGRTFSFYKFEKKLPRILK